MENVTITFVLPGEILDPKEASDIMQQAYEACKSNVADVRWSTAKEVLSSKFCKTDFIIFQDFQGKAFEAIKEREGVRILGPWCVSVCLLEGKPIPNYTWPIFNVAMMGSVVSCSHLPKTLKKEIQDKVKLMGGYYTDTLMSGNTHLITDSVKSEKYSQAAEAGVKLMLSSWIDSVWTESQSRKIQCDDEQFSKYRCPPFHNLKISSTGISSKEQREFLRDSIVKHGGSFMPNLNLATTDILVVVGSAGTNSAKYKAARTTTTVHCVTMEWITESIEHGYVLPYNNYSVKKSTSTPTKGEENDNPDFSMLSVIHAPIGHKTTLEETVNTSMVSGVFPLCNTLGSPVKRKSSSSDQFGDAIDGLDIKKAKKAGQFLESCSVYIAGFNTEHADKLSKILTLSGATKYDTICNRLTHVIVGDKTCTEVELVRSKNYPVTFVSVQWLIESMHKQCPVSEEHFLVNFTSTSRDQFGSPLSQKGLSLLRNRTLTEKQLNSSVVQAEPFIDQPESDIMQQYLPPETRDSESDTLAMLLRNADSKFGMPSERHDRSTATTHDENSETTETSEASARDLFANLRFLLLDLDPETSNTIKEDIEHLGGFVVSRAFKGVPDYVVAPSFTSSGIQVTAKEYVNEMWVIESIQEAEIKSVEYYHRPQVLPENVKPLEGCVVTISSYTSYERGFLKNLIEALGGVHQEQFARVTSEERNVKGSTHLVSLEASGKKYNAALKWKLPVVNKDWLLECARLGKMVPEKEYMVGQFKAPMKVNCASKSANKATAVIDATVDSSSITGTPEVEKQPGATLTFVTPVNLFKTKNGLADSNSTERTITSPHLQDQASERDNFTTPVSLFKERGRIGAVATDSPEVSSQVTPVNNIIRAVRESNLLGTPRTPPNPRHFQDIQCFQDMETPKTPLGAIVRPNPPPNFRKEMANWINKLPDFKPPTQERRLSTPLSELKRRIYRNCAPSSFWTQDQQDENNPGPQIQPPTDSDTHSTVSSEGKMAAQSTFVNAKLMEMEQMLTASTSKRRSSRQVEPEETPHVRETGGSESQPMTVGWDYGDHRDRDNQRRLFVISGVGDVAMRQKLVEEVEALGATVSELSSYDPNSTHLVCPRPVRNEKTLSFMAAGKWVLHIDYVKKSFNSAKFLDEEDFEFGNPKSASNIPVALDKENELRRQSVYYWRKEISRRGYGAFNDMRAIVVAAKRDPLVRLIQAGGGVVLDLEPPFDAPLHATHCLLEPKSVADMNLYAPLAKHGIYCVSTLYLSDYLNRINKEIPDCILPFFVRFYSNHH